MRERDPDLDLWRRAQNADAAAFDQLERKYRGLIHAEIRRRLYAAGGDDLQDVSQQVWIAVWRSLPRFRGEATFVTYLVGIAKNVCFEWLRGRRATEQIVEEATEDTGAESQEARIVQQIALHEAVKNLPATERELIHLRYFLQLTDEEIARQTGVPLGTVKGRLRAGLQRLRVGWQKGIASGGGEALK